MVSPDELWNEPGPVVTVGAVLGGRYVVVGRHGRGSVARVFRARDEIAGEEVAVKVLVVRPSKDDDDPLYLDRLRTVVEHVRAISHPSVVRPYAAVPVQFEGHPTAAVIVPWVPHATLRAELEEHGSLPLDRALHLADSIAEAVEAAHDRGVLHRDLRPEHVFVARLPDGTEYARVTDFLVSSVLEQEGGASAHLVTTAYSAPEQVRGASVDRRVDVYAIGLVLKEMLTGDNRRILASESGVPRTVRDVVERCLMSDAEDRYPDVGTLRTALANRLQTTLQPPPPRSSTSRPPPGRRVHQRPVWPLWALTVVVGVVVAVLYAIVFLL